MRIPAAVLMLLAAAVSSDSVEIGENELPSNNPFCGDCAASMRYQTLYLEDEIGSPIDIEAISLMRTIQAGATYVTLDTLVIYIGYCSGDELGTGFDGNYSPGTRQLVFWEEDCTISAPEPNQWFQIDLETPFSYSGSGNIIIEYAWPDGYGAVYNWNWTGTVARSLTGEWQSASGFTTQDCPHILLTYTNGLECTTFGAVKALLGSQ
ncbi:MAG: hypothetical protein JXA64_09790 [Candidatus Fermentibacteraceae bacterium]|nr:hypothetical protein [Candidatus Fermentibacteraceae bacterium]MBN2609390.1 hypothetical protein [Candidatus Fermentibacteraceae bacterium]